MWRCKGGIQIRCCTAELQAVSLAWLLALLFGLRTKARRRLIGVDTSGFGVIVGNILGDKPNSRSRRVESNRGLGRSFPRSVRRGALRAASTVQPEFLHTVVEASYYTVLFDRL